MDTAALKKFAQAARNLLMDQVKGKLGLVLAEGSPARREAGAAVKELEAAIARSGRDQVVDQVAYTWFNRFTALRFMDVNGYTTIRVVSPAEGQTRPELLAEALAGNIDEAVLAGIRTKVASLLDGRSPSSDPQGEAYRLLLVAVCNQWHEHMPFMFEKINDFTELLMPDDLLSQTSVLTHTRTAMTEDACKDVEVIGWLYQFYISEKKDQVFAGLKKNQKITAENIPAATQLFTPHWIVRYLVENSLGRLWLLNRPGSRLAQRMDYYIAPEEPETDFLKIGKPEDIKVCDPACGSGHMLTYAFDLLYAIYEEEGYDSSQIPALILRNNLTGVEIDDRAGALAAFALAMKAAKSLGRRKFLRMEVKPDIVVLRNVTFTAAEMQDVTAVVGRDLFTAELRETLLQFEQAKNLGSLIIPRLRVPAETLRIVEARDFGSDLLLKEVQERVLAVLQMADTLSPKYHVVVANPPYLSGNGMNPQVSLFMKEYYSEVKSDLFAAFIVRNTILAQSGGYLGFMTPFVWMFIASYEKLRNYIVGRGTISSLIQLEYSGFAGAVVPVCTFTLINRREENVKGTYIRLSDFPGKDAQAVKTLEAIRNPNCGWRFETDQRSFAKIGGTPIAYWLSPGVQASFSANKPLGDRYPVKSGIMTGDDGVFLKLWFELSINSIQFEAKSQHDMKLRFFPMSKGGEFRKWYGNSQHVVDLEDNGRRIATSGQNYRLRDPDLYFRPYITWSRISSGKIGFRVLDGGVVFADAAPGIFAGEDRYKVLAMANSKFASHVLQAINPTMNFQTGDIERLPSVGIENSEVAEKIVHATKWDWDAYEISWDFSTLPLLSPEYKEYNLAETYAHLRAYWHKLVDEVRVWEEQNNLTFINAYGLQEELKPELALEEVTLTCNPSYRYGIRNDTEANETRLRVDTVAEFLSYAVGCMFGRYSLDAPGLILADQGEALVDYLARVPEPSFMPDDDNVIPVLDRGWFPDDIVDRFRKFLRVTFGEDQFRENLTFIEAQVGDIRKYFTRGFYEDHVKRYKKRPIYWMFSSPKGTFQALIYMHRYRTETVSVLLNDYLREFIRKLEAERARLEKVSDDPAASQSQRTRALKDVAVVIKQIAELEEWEREVILPLAQAKKEIDFDDGVKQNYLLFGSALKPIKGLEVADE